MVTPEEMFGKRYEEGDLIFRQGDAGDTMYVIMSDEVEVSREKKGERGIWQRRFWEHVIRDETDFERHVDYIHYNPVKHGHVGSIAEWPYSSFRRYVRHGILPSSWAASDEVKDLDMG